MIEVFVRFPIRTHYNNCTLKTVPLSKLKIYIEISTYTDISTYITVPSVVLLVHVSSCHGASDGVSLTVKPTSVTLAFMFYQRSTKIHTDVYKTETFPTYFNAYLPYTYV